jgi:hypothetical protein
MGNKKKRDNLKEKEKRGKIKSILKLKKNTINAKGAKTKARRIWDEYLYIMEGGKYNFPLVRGRFGFLYDTHRPLC